MPIQHPWRVIALAAAAAAANCIRVELPGNTNLLLGVLIYMPLVLTLPWQWGTLAAGVALAATVERYGQPFPLLVGMVEALWLGLWLRRSKRSPVLLDLVFWGALGVPLVFAFCLGAADQPAVIAGLSAAKYVLNHVVAVALAALVLRHSDLGGWLVGRVSRRARMREVVFHLVIVLALVPLVLLGLGASALLSSYYRQENRELLTQTARRVAQQMDLFLEHHESVLRSMAGQLNQGRVDAQAMMDETQRAHPEFITMLLTDAEGRIRQAAPGRMLAAVRGTSVADRDYFIEARDRQEPFISPVFRGRGFGRDTIVAISAPFYDASGKFAGVIEGSLEVERFAQQIIGSDLHGDVDLILCDRTGRVIRADPETGSVSLDRIVHHPHGAIWANPEQGMEFDFDSGSGKTRFMAFGARAPGNGVVVFAQRPALAGVRGAAPIFVYFAVLAAGICLTAFWVSHLARRRMAKPLEDFARNASRQAAMRTVEPIPDQSAEATVEIAMVYSAFNQLAIQLQGTYAMLRQQNRELDARVAERTRELEQARQHAEAASRSKSDFLAITSHEIRTPLNAIISLSEAVSLKATDPQSVDQLRLIRNSGTRLLNVVNDLLDISRAEAGRLELHLAPVELGALVQEVGALFQLRARDLGVGLRLELEPALPLWLRADGPRLQQVLINLMGNALKFTKVGEVALHVSAGAAEAGRLRLRFAVTDTGPGISADEQARLFQPYVQLPGASASAVPGTGLGLSISRRLVTLFGGDLGVRSEVGRGSEFFFTFEAELAEPPAQAIPAPAATPAQALRVLAVDDNEANQEVLRVLLETHCRRLEIVGAVETALELAQRETFDLALIDLEMPEMDGFTMARLMRAPGSKAQACRLVAISAHAADEMWHRCAEAGFDGYLAKPIDRKRLAEVLQGRGAAPV